MPDVVVVVDGHEMVLAELFGAFDLGFLVLDAEVLGYFVVVFVALDVEESPDALVDFH